MWLFSLVVVAASNLITAKIEPVTFAGTLVGVTALIFLAKGDVWGQILTVVFSIMYAINSYKMRYENKIWYDKTATYFNDMSYGDDGYDEVTGAYNLGIITREKNGHFLAEQNIIFIPTTQ